MNKQEYLDQVAKLTAEYEDLNVDSNGANDIVGVLIEFKYDDMLYEWNGLTFLKVKNFKMQKVLKDKDI